jgi:hypothetical protein
MRSTKAVCLALAALNLVVFAVPSLRGGGDELKARVAISARRAEAAQARGAPVPFRLEGELPEPAALPALESAPAPAAPPEAPIDSDSYAYLGTMTSPEGTIEYFFKNKATGLVRSTGRRDDPIRVLESAEKEFLIEIDGTKYRVAR